MGTFLNSSGGDIIIKFQHDVFGFRRVRISASPPVLEHAGGLLRSTAATLAPTCGELASCRGSRASAQRACFFSVRPVYVRPSAGVSRIVVSQTDLVLAKLLVQ
jgi:hypothetical protein